MTKKSKLYRNGKYVRDFGPDDIEYVLADGESVRVETLFMDAMPVFNSAGHRPGEVSLADSERDRRADMYADHKAWLSQQWQNTPPLAADAARAPINTGDAREDAYEARNRHLSMAYLEAAR